MLTHSRTDEEILARIKEVEGTDFLGVYRVDLLGGLSFEAVKPFLKQEAIEEGEEEWNKGRKESAKDPGDAIRKYLPFAWEKANHCRGISAGRSLMHMITWAWFDKNEPLVRYLEEDYLWYGKQQLIVCSELYDFPWREHDDGAWRTSELEPEEPGKKVVYLRATAVTIARGIRTLLEDIKRGEGR
jgi:hypothetical protein